MYIVPARMAFPGCFLPVFLPGAAAATANLLRGSGCAWSGRVGVCRS